ncbi:hypothetical protein GU243_06055 [Pseudarthrobacter psychrotolerans]|uniref:Uncharacterized protein n=1 Tax=Pseudarthrobacter psychrotolerans TaxID=2697569 RepID=A0A6P1NFI4_9MICC|nr:hypothetical protein [Pseudarthrobacter psychrotolerans]QHK19375.1 hypothetical protein GU243_06055 [Pseudarthrobacter psychrotolerans]
MPDIKPYRLHRTWHLAGMLDELKDRGELEWKYSYDEANSRALFTVALAGKDSRTLQTRQAEELVQSVTDRLQIPWAAVPHWGGEDRWMETVAKIKAMQEGRTPMPLE